MLQARPTARGDDLTGREREVLALVTRGLAISRSRTPCHIAERTAKAYSGSIFQRNGVNDRTSPAICSDRNPYRSEPGRLPSPAAGGRVCGGSTSGGTTTIGQYPEFRASAEMEACATSCDAQRVDTDMTCLNSSRPAGIAQGTPSRPLAEP
ncbi:MAG: helix-turn-helix domain-containing protein [Cellulomonas sp.]